jgi:Flp pilus assembly protein TadG
MSSKPTRRPSDDERGAVLIEFALVLPLLLVLMAGMFDLGFAFQRYQAVTNAAREGARMAVLPGYSTGDVENRVAAYLAASGITGAVAPVVETITITPAGGALFTAKRVRVEVIHTFSLLGPIATLVHGTFGTVTMRSESVMRTEVASGGN